MIEIVKGNLLASKAEALVNTVNTVGVMGKGIALQFKKAFSINYKVYRDACKHGLFSIGEVLTVQEGDLMSNKYIINFPTKEHWRAPSKYEYIEKGLVALRAEIIRLEIKSIAIPPLGCGNGGLDWTKVKRMITSALKGLDCTIYLYEPNNNIKAVLQKEEKSKAVKLSPARAMLLHLMFQYEAMGDHASLFVANKLAWFLQRGGEPLRLKFEPHYYGPYAVQLNHVLHDLNGVYLKGMEQNEVKPFESLQLNYDKLSDVENFVKHQLSPEQRRRLDDVLKLLKGFESTYSVELLATVDFLTKDKGEVAIDEIVADLKEWSQRKADTFSPKDLEIAYTHLKEYSTTIFAE